MKKRWIVLGLCALLLLWPLAACGSGAGGSTDAALGNGAADGGSGWSEDSAAAESGEAAVTTAPQALQNAKIIRTGSMDLQTQDFDETDAFLRGLTEQQGGYLESTSVSGETGSRYADYTVRVPQEGYDAFFAQVGENCHVLGSSSQTQNITEQYADLESRLASQRTKHERLLALLAQADSMETIVTLESALADTEYEIEKLEGSLRQYDSLVNFSTIHISLRETASLDPVSTGNSFFSELGRALRSGGHGVVAFLRGFVLLCATVWPLLALFAIALAVFLGLRRRRKAKQQPPALPPLEKPGENKNGPPDSSDPS